MSNKRLYKITLAVIVCAITAYYFYYPALGFLPNMQCMFNKATGLYCMGCGGQRAFHALLHGHIVSAAQNNLLVFVVLPLVALKLYEEISSKKVLPTALYSRKIILPLVLFVVCFLVLRNIPLYPFTCLVPE
ncbi:DUF2752 domain-containing protein [Emticicia soli]|uniref:DUF2752 domain-containing protein n=2 Tax=Emticicia soli TaxID=2027878 RepID=A0ABW5JCR6_9BACT